MRMFWIYMAIAVPFWILDGLWLGVVAKDFYRTALGSLMAAKIQFLPATLFYLVYPAGLAYFAVVPYPGAVAKAALAGGLFGFFCYATYDLTNQATLAGWPWRLTVVDIAWGTALSAAAAIIAATVTR
jgi:uncharacterized membrane protein